MPQLKRKLMAEKWDEFARNTISPNASPLARTQICRAFYAGATMLMQVIQSLTPESEATDADIQTVDDLHQELRDFAEAVKRGRA